MKLRIKYPLSERIKSCNTCKLNSHKALGWGNPSASIVFVGINPSQKIEKDRLAFQSNAFLPFFKILKELKHDPQKFYFTNTVKCATPENREPTKTEVKACSGFLDEEMLSKCPRKIICFGKFVGKQYGISKLYTGLMSKQVDVWLLPHPSYISRFPKDCEKFKKHLEMILRK